MHPDHGKKAAPSLQKFRAPDPLRRLSDILKPDALDEETRQRIVRGVLGRGPGAGPGAASPPGAESPPPGPRPSPAREGRHPSHLREAVVSGNTDLLGAMAKRLKTLEVQQQAYRLEVKEKRDRLVEVEDKYASEKAKREEVEAMLVELFDEKTALEKEVKDMKEFLADYGLKWRGDDEGKKNSKENGNEKELLLPPASRPEPFDLYEGDMNIKFPDVQRSPSLSPRKSEGDAAAPTASPVDNFSLDIDLLKRNARILSDHVGERGVVKDGKCGVIKEREVVTVVVYKNGICVNGGLFRPFGWPLCDAVLRDLIEGYYPYEFKEKYPDGFPIEIVDHSSIAFRTDSSSTAAGGVKSLHDLQTNNQQPITREEFLRRLPASRITANGRIVQVRERVTNMIDGATKDTTVKHVTAAEARYREKCEGALGVESENGSAAVSPQRIKGMVAVLVRFPSGQKLTLQMDPDSTVADMRREIHVAFPSFTKEYEFRMAYPPKALTNHAETLRDLGLLSSCTLMIQLHTTTKA